MSNDIGSPWNLGTKIVDSAEAGTWTEACVGTFVDKRRCAITIVHDPEAANAGAYLYIFLVQAGGAAPGVGDEGEASIVLGSRGHWSENLGPGVDIYVVPSSGTSPFVVTQYTK